MYSKIQLRSRKLMCKDEQGGLGSDEIHVGGVVITPDLTVKVIRPDDMGNYDGGGVSTKPGDGRQKLVGINLDGASATKYPVKITFAGKTYTAKVPLFRHDPDAGILVSLPGLPALVAARAPFEDGKLPIKLPKLVGAVLVLAEKDFGGFSGWLTGSLRPAIARATKAAKTKLLRRLAVEGIRATHASEDLAALFAGLVKLDGALSEKATRAVALDAVLAGGPLIGDDISSPAVVHRVLTSQRRFDTTGRADSGDHTAKFVGGAGFDAAYAMDYDWLLYR